MSESTYQREGRDTLPSEAERLEGQLAMEVRLGVEGRQLKGQSPGPIFLGKRTREIDIYLKTRGLG